MRARKIIFNLLIGLSIFIFVGCVTALDTTKPVEIDRGYFSHTLKQNGKRIDILDAAKHFNTIPEASSKISSHRAWFWTSFGLAGVSGYFMGRSLVTHNSSDMWLTAGGFVLLSITDHWSRSFLADAAEIYNGKFIDKKTSLNFYLTPVHQGGLLGAAILF